MMGVKRLIQIFPAVQNVQAVGAGFKADGAACTSSVNSNLKREIEAT
jgi:hypothetical protein